VIVFNLFEDENSYYCTHRKSFSGNAMTTACVTTKIISPTQHSRLPGFFCD